MISTEFSRMFGGGLLCLAIGSAVFGWMHHRRSFKIGDSIQLQVKRSFLPCSDSDIAYPINTGQDVYCDFLCESTSTNNDWHDPMELAIREKQDYYYHWSVDGIPASSRLMDERQGVTEYYKGFPMGYLNHTDGQTYVYNHLNFEFHYRKKGLESYQIVGFVVSPLSTIQDTIPSCQVNKTQDIHTTYRMVAATNIHQPIESENDIKFTYDVIWKEDKTNVWSLRWDFHQSRANPIERSLSFIKHWFFLILFIAGIAACCMRCCCRRKDVNYTKLTTDEFDDEDMIDEGDIQLTDTSEHKVE